MFHNARVACAGGCAGHLRAGLGIGFIHAFETWIVKSICIFSRMDDRVISPLPAAPLERAAFIPRENAMSPVIRSHTNTARRSRWLLLAPLFMLAACQGTLNTRGATRQDTDQRWQPLMATMPIEVHGQAPALQAAALTAAIPHGVRRRDYAATHRQPIEASRHIVLYVGGDRLPTSASYCQIAPVMVDAPVTQGRVMLAGALCDGGRLVVAARRELPASKLTATAMPRTIERFKSFILYGLQPSQQFRCSNDDAGLCNSI